MKPELKLFAAGQVLPLRSAAAPGPRLEPRETQESLEKVEHG